MKRHFLRTLCLINIQIAASMSSMPKVFIYTQETKERGRWYVRTYDFVSANLTWLFSCKFAAYFQNVFS